MNSADVYTKRLYIFFEKRPKTAPRKWWHVFSADYAHCYVVINTVGGVMRIDSTYSGITMNEVGCDIFEYTAANSSRIINILCFDVECDTRYSSSRGIITCVSVVKAMMCSRIPWWVITPKQLYRWLSHGQTNQQSVRNDTKKA